MNTHDVKRQRIIDSLVKKATEILLPGSRMVLFGSRARNEAHDESDWDIHILVPGPERLDIFEQWRYMEPFQEVGWEYEEMVNVVVYSHQGWDKRSFLPFYKNVENDKIILFQN